ncbi:hypothetical protein ACFL59_10460 [Planctomycetota bacterium]
MANSYVGRGVASLRGVKKASLRSAGVSSFFAALRLALTASSPFDMHMHVRHHALMRTTIEITDEQRARLLALAAERGEKGFSRLVQEAIDLYLKEQIARHDRVKAALSVLASFRKKEADSLEASVRDLRRTWR